MNAAIPTINERHPDNPLRRIEEKLDWLIDHRCCCDECDVEVLNSKLDKLMAGQTALATDVAALKDMVQQLLDAQNKIVGIGAQHSPPITNQPV